MKRITIILVIAVIFMAVATSYAQDKVYKEGSVWSLGMIKTNANMNKEYLKQLKTTWIAVNDEAVKQGLILSYKVLSGVSANPEDFDILLLVEYKNLASMDGQEDKWDEIYKKVIGNDEAQKKLNEARLAMRSIYGGKWFREITYK
jgi:hypothetical protein